MSSSTSIADSSIIYTLRHQARCLEPILFNSYDLNGEDNISRFLIGTYDLNAQNEIHLVGYNEREQRVNSLIYKHPEQVISLSTCPKDHNLFFTCHEMINVDKVKRGCTLWKMPDSELLEQNGSYDNQPRSLIPLATMKTTKDRINKIIWDPTGNSNQIISLNTYSVALWTLTNDMLTCSNETELFSTASLNDSKPEVINCGKWQGQGQGQRLIVGHGETLSQIDLSSGKRSMNINTNHGRVLCMDSNPKIHYQLATGGFDGKVKIWDLRKPDFPIKEMFEHTHWIWSIEFNQQYDELLASSGSDARVNLYSNPSLASTQELNTSSPSDDKLISSYEQYGESVFSAKWSRSNPWVLAALTYYGQLSFHKVPDSERYRILL